MIKVEEKKRDKYLWEKIAKLNIRPEGGEWR